MTGANGADGDGDTDGSDGDERTLEERTRALHDHLAATAELPIDPRTNRWLGEAEAVARDAATSDVDEPTVRKRVGQVEHLLAEAGGTGNDDADAHLEAARALCRSILEE